MAVIAASCIEQTGVNNVLLVAVGASSSSTLTNIVRLTEGCVGRIGGIGQYRVVAVATIAGKRAADVPGRWVFEFSHRRTRLGVTMAVQTAAGLGYILSAAAGILTGVIDETIHMVSLIYNGSVVGKADRLGVALSAHHHVAGAQGYV